MVWSPSCVTYRVCGHLAILQVNFALRRLGDLNDCDLYMAGPPAMIDAALKDTVMAGKAAAERVFFDRFY